jgi:hypothetical protein
MVLGCSIVVALSMIVFFKITHPFTSPKPKLAPASPCLLSWHAAESSKRPQSRLFQDAVLAVAVREYKIAVNLQRSMPPIQYSPAAEMQCPVIDLIELIYGKSTPLLPKASLQFLISRLSFEVAVRCPLTASISEAKTPHWQAHLQYIFYRYWIGPSSNPSPLCPPEFTLPPMTSA